MPQANDSELTRLITVEKGGSVEDPAPNAVLDAAAGNFDLHLEGVAGVDLGGGGGTYNLTIVAFDLTTGTIQPGLSPNNGNPIAQAFNAANWSKFPSSGPVQEYVTNQTFTIPVSAGTFTGHVLIYSASLVSTSVDQVSLIVSSPFVLC
jgi:hypothetical protein